MSERMRRILPLVGVALLAAVPFRGFLSPGVPLGRDLLFYFLPLKAALAGAFVSGHVPWVDVARSGGLPLLQSPGAAAFDPGNILFLLLPPGAALKAWIVLRVVVGVLGFARFAGRLGLGRPEAAVAGLLYGLSGVTLSLTPFLGASAAHGILPWLAAALVDVRRDRAARAVAELAFVVGLLALTGVPEYGLYAGTVALVLALSDPRWQAPPPPAARLPLRWLAGLALGLCLAAPAVVVLLARAGDTVRGPGGGMTAAVAAEKSLPPARLLELLADGAVADWSQKLAAGEAPEYPYLPSITPGRVGLVLAIVGLLVPARGRLAASALAACGIVLALGPATPVWRLAAQHVPFFASFRYPEKHLILTGFGLAWLGALGLAALGERLEGRARSLVAAALAVLVVADRDGAARALLPLSPPALLERVPGVLGPLLSGPRAPTPPRVFVEAQYAVVPPEVQPRTLPEAFALHVSLAFPHAGALHGAGYVLERDYDLTAPRQLFEWTRLLARAVPAGDPLPRRLACALGARRIVGCGPGAGGRLEAEPVDVADPRPPFRFVSRVVRDADGRRLFARLLREGAEPDTAYVHDGSASLPREERPGPGTVVAVADTPSALGLTVEAGRGGGYLFLARPLVATQWASLDGKPVTVEDAWFGFAGVAVPEGRHRLELGPRPGLLPAAAIVGVMSLLAVLWLLVRRPSPAGPGAPCR